MNYEPRVLMREKRTGKLVLFHVRPDGTYVVETRQDVEPILAQNTMLRNAAPQGWKGDLHWVGSIPMPMFQQLRNEGVVQDHKAFKKFLNDPDHSKFRTKTGKL